MPKTQSLSPRMFSHEGIHVPYLKTGSGKTIVFLHGMGVTVEVYAPVIRALSREYTVYAPQLPFFRSTSIPDRPWTYLEYARYFSRFLDHLDLKNVDVIGFSYGAGIALALSSISPRVRSCVAINPAGAKRWAVLGYALRACVSFLRFLGGAHTLTKDIVSVFVLFIFRNALRLPVIVQTVIDSFGSYYQFLPHIRTPVLIVWSKHEELLPQTFRTYINSSMPHARIEYAPGFHNWIFFHTDILLEVLRSYYSSRSI